MAKEFFYQIVVDSKTFGADIFTYKSKIDLPERILVKVDFRGRKLLGFILKKLKRPNFPAQKIKAIEKVIDFAQLLDERRVKLAKIAADHYLTSLGKMIFWALPEIALRSVAKEPKENKIAKLITKNSKPIFYQTDVFKRFEFYKKLIKKEIKKKRQVLFLAPNLNHWMIKDLSNLFKPVVFASNLSRKKEYLLWREVLTGRIDLVIGSQKAIFTPLNRLNLIIVEDAGNPNYKQEQDPRIDLRFLAKNLAKVTRAKLIFSGLVPDPLTYLEIKKKKFILKKDFKKSQISLVDLFKQNKLIGFETEEIIKTALKKRKKIIFFYNRLGFSQLSLCSDCGFFDFQKGGIPLAFCPRCRGVKIKTHSFGLERLAYDFKKIFPRTDIALLFKSSQDQPKKLNIASSFAFRFNPPSLPTSRKLRWPRKLRRARQKFDLSVLGLAEIGLSLPDPYIAYKILHFGFEALSLGKKAIIQTFIPDHYLVKAFHNLDFEIFYQNWLKIRKKFHLAPDFKEIKIFALPQNKLDQFYKKLQEFKEIPASYKLADLEKQYILITLPQNRSISLALKKFLEKSRAEIDVDPID